MATLLQDFVALLAMTEHSFFDCDALCRTNRTYRDPLDSIVLQRMCFWS